MDNIKITINGVPLTSGQVMTVFAALQGFGVRMEEKNVLGADTHGEFMREAHLANVISINRIMVP